MRSRQPLRPYAAVSSPPLRMAEAHRERPAGLLRSTGPGSAHVSVAPWLLLARLRWAACLARLPQMAMLHHLRTRPRV